MFESLAADSGPVPAMRGRDDAPDAWDDLQPPDAGGVPASSLTMSGAAGALAFDLSHPRSTPSDGVPALLHLLEPDRAPAPEPESDRVTREPWHARLSALAARAIGLDRSARTLAWLVAACIGLGVVMVYSTSAIAAERDPRIADPLFFLRRQAVAAGIGLVACSILAHCSLRQWRYLARCAPWLAVIVLAAVLVPGIGHAANGARRWVRIAGIGFQPSDFARVGLVVYLAWCAAAHAAGQSRARWNAAVATLAVVGLIAIEPDIGTAATTMGVAVLIVWLGGLFRVRELAVVGAIGLPAAAIAAYAAFPHVRKRIGLFLGGTGTADAAAGSHQLVQSYVALGAGGPTGVGLGAGRQKLAFLPEESTDFILAMIGEELGFVGTCTVVLLFALLCVHGLAVAARARRPFAAMLAAGCTVLLATQAAANVAVVTGLMPTTGIPLPFISFGGSGTVALACAAGALIAVARDPAGQRDQWTWPEPPAQPEPQPAAIAVEDDLVEPRSAPARDNRDTERLDMAEILDPPPTETLIAPNLMAEICGVPPESDGLSAFDDSDPAIELDRETVIREAEFRELADTRWLERPPSDPTADDDPQEDTP